MKNVRKSRLKIERLGETRLMNCGMAATIKEYQSCRNMLVCFADGTLVPNCQYSAFKEGNIFNRNLKSANNKGNDLLNKSNSRVGEVKTMNCGKKAEIIEYRNANDIDIKFLDSGEVQTNRKYQHFKNGNISPRN